MFYSERLVSLAGRTIEEIVFNEITPGASSDREAGRSDELKHRPSIIPKSEDGSDRKSFGAAPNPV